MYIPAQRDQIVQTVSSLCVEAKKGSEAAFLFALGAVVSSTSQIRHYQFFGDEEISVL